jgi:ubiquinol-cytochrome c reductase cytochrome b subunit
MGNAMLGSAVSLNGQGRYIHWGAVQLSWANLIVILLMLVVFALALVIPFPRPRRHQPSAGPGPRPGTAPATLPGDERMLTARLRGPVVDALPPDKLLPDRQPAYVQSWIYIFGVLTLAALAMVLVSGAGLAVGGPSWWHRSTVGLFFNSLHLWSTEAFFFFMVIHLWGKFFMAAWRGNRRLTWVTGGIAFVVSVGTAFTGYLSQQNFDSEWISTQAKDGINSTGAGSIMNVLNFGQMLMWHILLLPLVLGVLVVGHVLLVRRRGVVPPFERHPAQEDAEATELGPVAVEARDAEEVRS